MDAALFVVDIQKWEWPLHVAAVRASPGSGVERELLCAESIVIEGLVRAPNQYKSNRIYLSLTPLPREVIVGDGDKFVVGHLQKNPPGREDLDFFGRLFLPADHLQNAILCLNSLWRSVDIWVEEGEDGGPVTNFAFSSDV